MWTSRAGYGYISLKAHYIIRLLKLGVSLGLLIILSTLIYCRSQRKSLTTKIHKMTWWVIIWWSMLYMCNETMKMFNIIIISYMNVVNKVVKYNLWDMLITSLTDWNWERDKEWVMKCGQPTICIMWFLKGHNTEWLTQLQNWCRWWREMINLLTMALFLLLL